MATLTQSLQIKSRCYSNAVWSGTALLVLVAWQASAAGSFDWPQWRGPDRTDVSRETGLLQSWPAGGPKRVWLFEIAGMGYSGPAIVDGKLFTMGTRDGAEVLLALDAGSGQERWATKLGSILENDWGDGPRGTPAVDADRVYALSGSGVLVCAKATDGSILWQRKMSEFGGGTPGWGFTESPLVEGGMVFCTPGGGKGAIVALDRMTGALKWQSSEFTDPAQYSSLVPAELHGVRQLIQLTAKSVAGVAANDGKLLWRCDWPGRVAVIPTP
ncbi:MAG TPA: PQQ-binding-like beta-propeller repeat protein, partial [Verrucomicrobiae bacterium]|nr:PQQ-binding-like beta-propeller repeat protein [Verrucomicrobiae bacterium]